MMTNSTVRMMYLTKRLATLLLLIGMLFLLCACDRTDVPDESVTHGSGVTQSQNSVDDEPETEAMSEKETEADTGKMTEAGDETESENDTDTQTEPDSDTDSETTSPVIELPKVEFD